MSWHACTASGKKKNYGRTFAQKWMISSMKRELVENAEKKRDSYTEGSSCSTDKHKRSELSLIRSFHGKKFRAVGVCLSTLQFLLSTRGCRPEYNIFTSRDANALNSDLTRLLSIPCLPRIRITHTHTSSKRLLHNAVTPTHHRIMEMTRSRPNCEFGKRRGIFDLVKNALLAYFA